jgi:arsenite-transporting ATPase
VRVLLFTGPGGAGTTTLTTAAAVRSARSGHSTALLSRQAPAVAGLDDVEGLRVVRVGGQKALERLWGQYVGPVAGALPLLSLPPASSLPALPGTGELALLAGIAEADDDVVVVDAGPVDSATGLLALPATLRWWLDHLLPQRLRVLAALRSATLEPGSEARAAADAALTGLASLEAALGGLALADPSVTSVVLTARARAAAVPVLRSAATALGLHGQRPAAVAVRVLAEGPGDWWAARVAEQEAALRELGELGPLRRVQEVAVAPLDADEATALAPELPEPAEPFAAPAAEEVPGGWRLSVPMPFAHRDDVELTRWADDLVVSAAGARRSIRLDSLLRRCRVTGGTLAGAGTASAHLDVRFAPDPQQWPADLLSAHQRGAAEEES